MTKEDLIAEIRDRLERAREDMKESAGDIRTPGFNQDLGYYDALGELIEWIEESNG
jgi:hypothetical protein